MATKKKTSKGNSKQSAKSTGNTEKPKADIRTAAAEVRNESEHGQAWERGESIPCAKDESQ